MQRKSWLAAVALAGGLVGGLVFGPALTGSASAQTASPGASATASASAAQDDSTVAPDDCPPTRRRWGRKRTERVGNAPSITCNRHIRRRVGKSVRVETSQSSGRTTRPLLSSSAAPA